MGVEGCGEGVVYLTSLGRPTDIDLQLSKACYPCRGKCRGGCFYFFCFFTFILALFLPCPSLSFPLLSLFSLSLGDDTK